MELPKEPIKANQGRLNTLVIFSNPKTGKTSLLSKLPNNLIIDTEDGADFTDSMRINVLKEANSQNTNPVAILTMIAQKIREANKEKGDFVYDYISIDTLTGLERYARKYATILYKKSLVGKNFEGDDVVTQLKEGAGYEWLRRAFTEILMPFRGLARKCLILTGHTTLKSSVNKKAEDIQVRDLMLTGKIKTDVLQSVDATGYLMRDAEDPNKVVIIFRNSEKDLATGARPEHLINAEFVISERIPETGEIKTYWEKIFK